MARYVIFQPHGVGDALMALPAIDALHLAAPDADLTVITGGEAAAALLTAGRPWLTARALKGKGGVEKTVDLIRAMGGLRRGRVDGAMIATALPRKWALAARHILGAKRIVGGGKGAKLRDVTEWAAIPPHAHRAEANIAIAGLLAGVEFTDTPTAQIHPPDDLMRKAAAWRGETLPGVTCVIGVHPGSGGMQPVKRLPPALLDQTLARLTDNDPSWGAVVFAGPEEPDIRENFAPSNPRIVLAPEAGVLETAALIGACDAFFAGDTGLGHIASAMGLKALTAAGPTSIVDTRPFGAGHHLLEREPRLNCQPCYGGPLYGRCPYAIRCLTELTPEDAATALAGLVG